MRVDGFTQVHQPHAIKPHHLHRTHETGKASSARQPGPVDKLDISAEAQAVSQAQESGQVRQQLISRIRQQIADGTYETPQKLDQTLDRLLDELT